MGKIIKIITVLIISSLMISCSTTQKTPDKMYYRFPVTTLESSNTSHQQMVINRPTAMGILANRPMVAETLDGALIQMQHNLWLESPRILLQDYLKKTFKTHDNRDAEKPKMYLNSHIMNFEKNQNSAVLSIKYTLLDDNHKTVYSQEYKSSKTLSENTIAHFVKAIHTLIKENVQQLINDLP